MTGNAGRKREMNRGDIHSRTVSRKLAVSLLFLLAVGMAVLQGCAVRPRQAVPENLTVSDVFTAFDARSAAIRDFRVKALAVGTDADGNTKSLGLSVRYRAPHGIRIVAKAFAGIAVGVITADADSLSVFFPSENAYVKMGRTDPMVFTLLAGFGLDPDRLISFVTGSLPTADIRDGYEASIAVNGGKAVMTLNGRGDTRRYVIENRDIRIAGEAFERSGIKVYERRMSRYSIVDGIPMPGRIVVEHERGKMDIGLSDYELNVGLTDDDVAFVIPPGAERLLPRHVIGIL